MSTVSASTARQTLPAQLDRVEAGEEVAITRHGRVVAVLVSPGTLAARRAPRAWSHAEEIGARIEAARTAPLATADLTTERADQLVDAVHTDRAAR